MKQDTAEQVIMISLGSCVVVGAVTLLVLAVQLLSWPWTLALIIATAMAVVLAGRHRRRTLPRDERGDGPRATEELRLGSDGASTVMVPFGARLPLEVSETFSTADDDQQSVEIRLVARMSEASSARTVAVYSHQLVSPGPRGKPQIRVTLRLDEQGAIDVEVTEGGDRWRATHYRGTAIGVSTNAPPASWN